MARLLIVTPAPRGSRKGNRITAERWASLLQAAGHEVAISEEYRHQTVDGLVALHARKSAASIARFRAEHQTSPLFVVLTGTDLYHDLRSSSAAQHSLDLATRIIVLQPEGQRGLPRKWRLKSRVVVQSAQAAARRPPPRRDRWEVAVVGHLRPVKDPFRTALAVRSLPAASHLHVVQIGSALSPAMRHRAERETAGNPRYTWLGELSHAQTMQRMSQCRLLVLSSRLEGGANVISEAVVSGVPVLASRIPGSIGLLGAKYPGYFEVGDTSALRSLLLRAESDCEFYRRLANWCRKLQDQFTPEQERDSWRRILAEFWKPS